MGEVTVSTIKSIVEQITSLDRDATIYAAEPWGADSVAIVSIEPDSGCTPEEANSLGLAYFIEVDVACDFLDGWVSLLDYSPTLEEKCSRLISYAINDA
jgi:hypothetical protein